MKLTLIILVSCLLHVSASTLAQRLTYQNKAATVQQVFKEIKKQTGYNVLYATTQVDDKRLFNANFRNAELKLVLDAVISGQKLAYTIDKNNIFIKEKAETFFGNVTDAVESLMQPKFDVRGIVHNANGIYMIGASISVKGTSKVTLSDEKGTFLIKDVSPQDVLVVSFVGYLNQEVTIKDGSFLDVVLKEKVGELGEVTVSTGYQNLKSVKVTGAVSTVGAEELGKRNVTNLLTNLEGKIPGLVLNNGSVQIRGLSTLQANTNVLVVVDGFPIEGSIGDINPYDVENVTVLKDAAAAAIYGARASNGVIVVTTKKAKVKNKTVVEFSSNINYLQKPDYENYHYLTPAQQVGVESQYYDYWFNRNSSGSPTVMANTFRADMEAGAPVSPVQYAYYQQATGSLSGAQLQARLDALKGNDFVKQFRDNALRNQVIQQYNLAIRTNTDRSQSSLVLNYKTDNSGIINAYDKQLNIFYNGSYKIAKWADFNYAVNMVLGKTRKQHNLNATTPFNVPSYYSLYDSNNGHAQYSLSTFNAYSSANKTLADNGFYPLGFNHLDELSRDYEKTTSRNARYQVSLDLRPFSGLTIRPQFQYEDNNADMTAYSEKGSYTMRSLYDTFVQKTGSTFVPLLPNSGKEKLYNTRSPSYTGRLQVNYDKEFGKHGISFIAGSEFRKTGNLVKSSVLLGYDDQLQTQSTTSINYEALRQLNQSIYSRYASPSLAYAQEINVFGTSDVEHRFASGYANLTYSYDQKYNLFGSIRKDYADLFGGDSKYRGRPLWSVGASWLISDEPFMNSMRNVVDYLKLRTSYGVTGNIALNYTARLTANLAGNNLNNGLPIAVVTNPPNAKLRWEKTASTNLGLDFALFNNRLRGSFDVYRKAGTDLLAQKRLDVTQGFTTLVINNGAMVNKGVELALTYDWFKPSNARDLRWMSSVIVSRNSNKITEVDDVANTPYLLAGSGAFVEGRPVRSLYSYQYAGLNATGLPQWILSNGSITTNTIPSTDVNAVVFSGGLDPKLNISFNNEVNWKGIGFAVYAVYYGGHYIRNNPPTLYDRPFYGAMPASILNSWTPTNTATDIPGFGQYFQASANNVPLAYADKWVTHADFIKIRNLILSYNLPVLLSKKLNVSNIKLRFQVDNPNILWTRNKLEIDPETNGLRLPTNFILGGTVNF